ncbi:hypothetical protein KC19_8G117400 [Ceratodon purpureus]|uniref:WRKY domain-containing protein n=1 Tax=Ceratodon purpureus TaxID=3225 RepID=A0A8T0H076_CERPU|nr:hypothetical protein KC19_8G117400 [Ceratodon purpureus]
MEGPTRPVGQQGGSASTGKEVEVDYIQRIMRSLTDSSTSSQAAVPSQSNEDESGIGSSSYSFNDSYARIPDVSPGLNPWSYFPPPPELRGLVADSSEPNWRSTYGSPQILSPIQREILVDFPWLNDEVEQRRLISNSVGAVSSSEVNFPRLTSSREESDACTTSVSALEPSIETPTDQVAWAQSMLELQAFENSAPEELPSARDSSKAQTRFPDQAVFPERSTTPTPANSETPFNSESLSSSLSDGEAELKKGSRKKGDDAAGTSAQSGKRKRAAAEQEDGEDDKSDDQDTKKPMARVVCRNRLRKKGGVKRVREPRYAIKTRTDTEVMDDGYKWRKYGQKAVKNSPHPRNYYRCTTPNCPVRKRVERCLEDPGLVVTTYEGTHTHQSPSFLRGPPGYPGGLQALLATLSHHYMLAGNPPLPPLNSPHSSTGFPLSGSDPYRSSPLWLSQLQSQGAIQENLNLVRAHEQLVRLHQAEAEAAWASSIKSEPSFQFPGQAHGPSFSNLSSLSDLTYDSRVSHYDTLNKSSVSDQLGGGQINHLDYSSLISGAGPFPSVQQQHAPFGRRSEYVEAGVLSREDENFRAAPCSQDSSGASSDHGGLLEDMFRPSNPSNSRA